MTDKNWRNPKPRVCELLDQQSDVFRERHKMYGDNYKRFGDVMTHLFPNGVFIQTKSDWNRIGVFVQVISKITRYSNNWREGHDDSLCDMAVYATMLRELDEAFNAYESEGQDK